MRFVPKFLESQFVTPDVSHYPDTLMPLAHAERHHSVVEKAERAAKAGDESPSAVEDGREGSIAAYDVHTIEGLKAEIDADLAAFGSDSVYDRKSKVINKAIQDIGMGKYQWELFTLCGFGWFADNFWLQGVAITLPQLSAEFDVSVRHVRFTTFALFVGLCIGASFWGIASDVIGRRLAFNTTLFIGAVFGLAVGGAPNWIAVCALFSCMGLGIGGNLPVDGALFLEFLPFASGNLLTLLSIWWPVGALIASMIAWGLVGSYSCPADPPIPSCLRDPTAVPCCGKENNMGWRYFTFTLGAITFFQWFARFVLFRMFESPKFLLSRGRQAEAVAVVHGIAHHNGVKTWLTEEILNEVGGDPEIHGETKLSVVEIVKRSLSKFSAQRVGPLFSNWKLGLTTGLLWFQWLTIGMAYPLFNAFLLQYLSSNGAGGSVSTYITYRDYAITTVVGVPGSAIAYYTVNIKYIGRKGTMAIATVLTGIFVFLFTISTNSNFQLAFTSLVSFFQNIMYGVLYAYTPEVFPAPNRGTGSGIASFLNRVGGFSAPLVAIYASTNPKAPIYACGGLFIAAFVSMLALPIETRGRQSL